MKRAFSLQRRHVEEAMRSHGVNAAQAGVLTVLLDTPGLSSSELGRRLVITAQAAMVAVASLEEQELLERRDDPNHGRIRRCFLTKEGRRVAQACAAEGLEVERKLFAAFEPEQLGALADLLSLILAERPPQMAAAANRAHTSTADLERNGAKGGGVTRPKARRPSRRQRR